MFDTKVSEKNSASSSAIDIRVSGNKCCCNCAFMAYIISKGYMHCRSPFVAGIVERVNRIHLRRINLRNPRHSSAVFADYRGSSGCSDALQRNLGTCRPYLMRSNSTIMNLIAIHRRNSLRSIFCKRIFAKRFISRRLTFISQNCTTSWQRTLFPRSAFIRYSFVNSTFNHLQFYANIFLFMEIRVQQLCSLINAFINENQILLLIQGICRILLQMEHSQYYFATTQIARMFTENPPTNIA